MWSRIEDPTGALRLASAAHPIDIDLGCGEFNKPPGAIGIDILAGPHVDVVADAFDAVAALPDASVANAYSHHFFEHLDDPIAMFLALGRVVRPGGRVHVTVPHFTNPYYYSDPTHKSFFGLYTLSYLAEDNRFRRRVPSYFGNPDFVIEDAQLVFKAIRPYYLSYAANKVVGKIVNARPRNQEYYEGRLSNLWSCYEVRWVLRRR